MKETEDEHFTAYRGMYWRDSIWQTEKTKNIQMKPSMSILPHTEVCIGEIPSGKQKN
jgi:hypothetical protein